MKQVIFIGGTSYSGTTLLDLTLANDPRGFSCGEVRDYFYPTRRHHANQICGCGDKSCNIWGEIKKRGEENLFESIFTLFPDINFIIDSSKDPLWIAKQSKVLESKGINTANIVIWKTPDEIAKSYHKRGRLEEWHKRWINYHRLYYTVINNWKSIKCTDFVNDPSLLEKICNYLDIPYFEDKKQYKNKVLHTLFGNNSARIDLYNRDSKEYIDLENRLIFKQKGEKRIDRGKTTIDKSVEKITSQNKFVNEIEEVLKMRDILNCKKDIISEPNIRLNVFTLWWRSLKRIGRFGIGNIKYSQT